MTTLASGPRLGGKLVAATFNGGGLTATVLCKDGVQRTGNVMKTLNGVMCFITGDDAEVLDALEWLRDKMLTDSITASGRVIRICRKCRADFVSTARQQGSTRAQVRCSCGELHVFEITHLGDHD